MAARARPNGRSVSGMVLGLEDDNHRLVEENARLQEEISRLRAETANLGKEVTNIEAERDDYIKECAAERSKEEDVRKIIYAQVKAEFERPHQVLDILHSTMDHDTWFSIIDSRENAYNSRIQKQQLAFQVKEKEIEELRKTNRQKETEMAVLRSWSMTLLFTMAPD
jgi:cell division protein FtsB